jgi:hypothetical protein
MAGKAQSPDPVVVRLDATAFAVPELVTMGCNYGSVLPSTMLARGLADDFQ